MLRKMSQNDETASSVEQGAQTTDSVFDFLYHDARRVGSFLAQIDPSGHLTLLKQTEAAESGSGMKFSATASGTVVVARGGAAMEDQRTAGQRESLERTYDPLWTNALTLLDMLDERGMIHNSLEATCIGQFVKVSDLTLWKGLWSLPALKQVLTENAFAEQQASSGVSASAPQSSQQRKRDRNIKAVQGPTNVLEHQMEGALALVGMLPHTIQARLMMDGGASVWCSLREDGLIVSASDLTLKHGVMVSGRWTMVGVLDAYPEVDVEGKATTTDAEAVTASRIAGGSPLGELMVSLMPAIRGLLGRPQQAHGITPLVIFREVSG